MMSLDLGYVLSCAPRGFRAEAVKFGKNDARLTLRKDQHYAQVYLGTDSPEAAWQRCLNKLRSALRDAETEEDV